VAELFTREELEQLERRARQLAQDYDDEPSLRESLQLLAETAANLIPKLGMARHST
jgi:hypothetical protein